MATEVIIPEVLPASRDIVAAGEWKFEETSYEPPAKVTAREVALLSDNDLLTGFKHQHKRTQAELDAFVIFYDEIVARFKGAQLRGADGQFQSSGRPTLKEALDAIGLNYEAARKRKQRYVAALNEQLLLLKPLDDGQVAKAAEKELDRLTPRKRAKQYPRESASCPPTGISKSTIGTAAATEDTTTSPTAS